MTIEELTQKYKTSYMFHKQTKMSANSYLNWIKWGFIPIVSQYKIEEFTNGELKANFKHAKVNHDR